MFATAELRPRLSHILADGYTLSASGTKAYGRTLCGQGGTDAWDVQCGRCHRKQERAAARKEGRVNA